MKGILPIILLHLFTCSAQGQGYWQQQANFQIEVTLNDQQKSIDGKLTLDYTNNSPDTLQFIWFHLWPNAYSNRNTAFSRQLLQNGSTAFYFTNEKNRGYINGLDFVSGNQHLKTEPHPVYIDVVKLWLDKALLPGASIMISTPFHVQLPKRISRSGYTKDDIAVTQWFPKPAVYDQKGWHPMPYLDHGEFYSDFGNYDVSIKIPNDYTVAATGSLIDSFPLNDSIKILRYKEVSVPDFAWFVSRDYEWKQDSLKLSSGKTVQVRAYYFPEYSTIWKDALEYAIDAIRYRSEILGEYPYDVATVVQGLDNFEGGMEYPTITLVSGSTKGKMLEYIIEHELGHNWFQSALGSNEREHPWMDEGMNTYFDYKYFEHKYQNSDFLFDDDLNIKVRSRKLPSNLFDFSLQAMESLGYGQAISTPSYELTQINNSLVPYHKTARWLEIIEKHMGWPLMHQAFNSYYKLWQNKHPQPEDFKHILDSTYRSRNGDKLHSLDSFYSLINTNGSLLPVSSNRRIKAAFGFNFNKTESIQYISLFPLLGYNKYDKLMPGLLLHSYNIPNGKFNFIAAPLYATGSRQLNGYARISYAPRKNTGELRFQAGADFMRFSSRAALDSNGKKQFEKFTRLSPFVRIIFPQSPVSSLRRFFEFRSFVTSETVFTSFTTPSPPNIPAYVKQSSTVHRYLNQLIYHHLDNRVLHPYDVKIQFQLGNDFYRADLTGNYFVNYKNYGGLSVRFFGSHFGFLRKEFKNDPASLRFMPKLMGVNGIEDYSYSNYFVGRSASQSSPYESIPNGGLAAQQIMNRDGGFKMRLDQFEQLQGRSGKWVSALNFSSTIPYALLPVKNPLRLFFDIGTNAELLANDNEGPSLLYDGGVQLSLFKGLLNIYAPLVYSNQIRKSLRDASSMDTFGKRITFSIDIQKINIRKFTANQVPL